MDSQIKKIDLIANHMCVYQKKHNITGRCTDNVTILYDIIKKSFKTLNPVFQNVIVSFNKNGIGHVCEGHIVIKLDNGALIDPSYEIAREPDSSYLSNFETFREMVECNDAIKPLMNNIEKGFNHFKKITQRMNNGAFGISNDEYYINLIKYLVDIGIITSSKNELIYLKSLTNIDATY